MIASGIRKFIPVLLWALVILFLSIMPSDELPETDIKLADKMAHFAVYAVLSVLLVKNYRSYRPVPIPLRTWARMFIVVTGYGIFIEIIQECCIVSRFGEMADGVANVSGSIFGLVFARFWR